VTINATTEQAADSLATRLEMPALVRSLQDVLGQRMVAVIAGVSDAKAVGKWAKGERTPHPETAASILACVFWLRLNVFHGARPWPTSTSRNARELTMVTPRKEPRACSLRSPVTR